MKKAKVKKFQFILETIQDICASQYVVEYVIGITARPNARMLQYSYDKTDNFVILYTRVKAKNAIRLEEFIFNSIKYERPTCKRKYNREKIDGPYRPSLGGSKRYIGKDYSVYMAWKNAI